MDRSEKQSDNHALLLTNLYRILGRSVCSRCLSTRCALLVSKRSCSMCIRAKDLFCQLTIMSVSVVHVNQTLELGKCKLPQHTTAMALLTSAPLNAS